MKIEQKIYNIKIFSIINRICERLAEIESEKEALTFELEKLKGSISAQSATYNVNDTHKMGKIFTKTNGAKCFYHELNYQESNDL